MRRISVLQICIFIYPVLRYQYSLCFSAKKLFRRMLSFFCVEKHEPSAFFINYIKCAARCRLEIISQPSHPFGREVLHPEIYRGRPQCKAHPDRTKSKARRPCHQKISKPGGGSRRPALHRDDRADQSGRHVQPGQREPSCRICVPMC